MATVTLTTLDQAVAAFYDKIRELTFLQPSRAEVERQFADLFAQLSPSISVDDVFARVLFNDVDALDSAENQKVVNSYVNRAAIDDAATFLEILESHVLGLTFAGQSVASKFVSLYQTYVKVTDLGTVAQKTLGQASIFSALVGGASGLVTGGLALTAAVDDYLQIRDAGTGGADLVAAELGLAEATLGLAGSLNSTIRASLVLGYTLAGQPANVSAIWGSGLVPRFSDATVAASTAAKIVGGAAAGIGTLISLAQIGFAAYNFAETVKGWQQASDAGTPVSATTIALGSASFALQTVTGILGVATGVATLVFPPLGLVLGVITAVVGLISVLFDLFVGIFTGQAGFTDTVFHGSDAGDQVHHVTYSDINIFSYGGDDTISVRLKSPNNVPLGFNTANNTIDGGDGTDTLNLYNFGYAEVNPPSKNIVTLGGNWSLANIIPGDSYVLNVARIRNIENVIGTSARDDITGDAKNNTLVGRDNYDTLRGGDGDDILSGGLGNDEFYGGAGTDTVNYSLDTNEFRSSQIFGIDASLERGNSINLETRQVDDYTFSSIENLVGSRLNDILTGDGNANLLAGAAGSDTLSGGAGKDTLIGGEGNDLIYGGSEDDVIGGSFGYDTVDGGAGTDTLSYQVDGREFSGYRWIFVDLTNGYASNALVGSTSTDRDTLRSIENVVGSDGNDVIIGNNDNNVFLGVKGNDELSGANGNDTLIGGEGDDIISGGAGDDVISGGAGYDLLRGGDGIDTLNYSIAADEDNFQNNAGLNIDLLNNTVRRTGLNFLNNNGLLDEISGFENVIATKYNDAVNGDQGNNLLNGLAGSDLLSGLGGDDTLIGAEGIDNIMGGDGNDLLSGGTSKDTLDGGNGVDTVNYLLDPTERQNYVSINVNLATGYTTVRDAGATYVNEDRLISIEYVIASNGNDTIDGSSVANFLYGADGNDRINGAAGVDTLVGGIGNDTIDGGTEADAVVGGDGNDSLIGGAGDDHLSGEAGNDTLDGGADTDTAVFAGESARWQIDLVAGTARRGGPTTASIVLEDTLRSIENVTTGMGNDTIIGSAVANQILGGAGNDIIDGGAGNDMLAGDAGNDRILGGDNDDNIIGGLGNDTIDGGAGRDVAAYSEGLSAEQFAVYGATLKGFEADLGTTFATVRAISTSGATLETDQVTNVEGFLLSDRADKTIVSGLLAYNSDAARGVDLLDLSSLGNSAAAYANLATGVVTLVTTGANVTQTHLNYENVNGTNRGDVIIGGNGANHLQGLGGDDLFYGGIGADTLDGGSGVDTASYSTALGGVTINLATGAVSGDEATGDRLISIENVVGSRYADTLTGNSGANAINGGAGIDVMFGGGGADSFVYAPGGERDTIRDFASDDVIRLSGFTGATSYAQILGIATQVGSDVILNFNATDKLVLSNYTIGQLQADDFQFA